jgi:hypothetical protein
MQLVDFCCADFDIFLQRVQRQDPISLTLCFGDEGLACVAWGDAPTDVLLAVARSHCKQRVVFVMFKALCVNGVCRCFLLGKIFYI